MMRSKFAVNATDPSRPFEIAADDTLAGKSTDVALVELLERSHPAEPIAAPSEGTIEDRDRLLAIFTHDLRSLLGALSLNTELFLRNSGAKLETGAAKLQTNAGNVRRVIGRMDRLISSLIDLARLNAGKLDVFLERRDAGDVIREAVEIAQPIALEKGVQLTVAGAGRPLLARIDYDRLYQVLSNLLSNAIKFTPKGGHITVIVTALDGTLGVVVRDTGIGIPEADLEVIFECYRQLGTGRDGLGLGLFISRAIVEAHGGRIWAANSTSEPGAEFSFTVPTLDSLDPVSASPPR